MLKKGYKRALAFLIAFFLLIPTGISVQAQPKTTDYNVTRLFGRSRYDTSLEICRYGWSSGTSNAILVSGKDFPDALCASPLSYKLNAPIILTTGDTLNSDIIDELNKLGVENVYIIGGTGVVSQGIANQLASMNIKINRLGGKDRYETSVMVANEINSDKICVVTGQDFPDALSIASAASSEQMPIILTTRNYVPSKVQSYVKSIHPSKTYIIGGPGVISDNAANFFDNNERVYGANRYKTNYEVIKKFYGDEDFSGVFMACGKNYPDGICASALAAKNNSPVMLIDDGMESCQIKEIRDIKDKVTQRVVTGGTAVTPDYVVARMFADGTAITPEDYIYEYKNEINSDAITALGYLKDGQYLYPNDAELNSFINTLAPGILNRAEQLHQSGDYNDAMNLYDALLQLKIPDNIKNQSIVFKYAAESGNKIISKYVYKDSYKNIVQSGLNYYKNNNLKYEDNIQYSAMGDYLDFSDTRNFTPSSTLKFDSNGIPMVKYGNKFYYNPVTVAQYALHLHSSYIKGDTTKLADFFKCADFLENYMSPDGSLRYTFDFETLKAGWTSSMAQGETLSVLSRAYVLSVEEGKPRTDYIDCGNKIFNYAITPVQNGGVMDNLSALDPSLSGYIFFQEYVNNAHEYTLNGFIFTLFGIYDWYQLSGSTNMINAELTKHYYEEGIKSLKVVLPYYDLGGYTSYDLTFLINGSTPHCSNNYHVVHIEQLQAIYSITKDPFFNDIRNQWISYVN